MKCTLSSACTALLMLGLLTACGGGGAGGGGAGGGGTTTPVIPDPEIPGPSTPDPEVPRTTTGLRGGATDLLGIWAPEGVADYTTLAVVPASGSASYAGYLYGDLSTAAGDVTDTVAGRLTLQVAFGAQTATFTGSASDFVDGRDDPLSGTLTVSGGNFNRDGNPSADATLRGIAVDGTLQDGDGTDWAVGVRLEGDFLGETAEAVGGEAIGRITVGTAARDFDGGFIAEE